MTPEQLEIVATRWLGWKAGEVATCRRSRRADKEPVYCVTHRVWGEHPVVKRTVALPDMYSDETFGKLVLVLWRANRNVGVIWQSLTGPRVTSFVVDGEDFDRAAVNIKDFDPKAALLQLAYDLATKESSNA